MADFRIFGVEAGGGRLAIAPLPGRSGGYEADVSVLLKWSPSLVVSMTTGAEMQATGAECLGRELELAGVAWRQFPVADFSVPPPESEADWQELSGAALAHLGHGEGVLIHCMGGQGRSGMAALRLMVEAGEDADSALARLRSVRPGAVETAEQFVWASRG